MADITQPEKFLISGCIFTTITQRRAAASTIGDRLREDRRCFGFHHHGWSTTLDLLPTGPAVTRSIPFSQAFHIFRNYFHFFLLLLDFLDWQPWILTTDTHQHISIFLVSGFGYFSFQFHRASVYLNLICKKLSTSRSQLYTEERPILKIDAWQAFLFSATFITKICLNSYPLLERL